VGTKKKEKKKEANIQQTNKQFKKNESTGSFVFFFFRVAGVVLRERAPVAPEKKP
jgi:hypothetical protein